MSVQPATPNDLFGTVDAAMLDVQTHAEGPVGVLPLTGSSGSATGRRATCSV